MINARNLAYQILLHIQKDASHPDRLIRGMLNRHSLLEERDRALLTELVYGVLRWQGRLDWHIDQLSRTSPGRIDPAIRILLRLALYQLLMLDRIPEHAAVNEAVKIARSTQPPHLVKFVNAILREAIRREGHWEWPPVEKKPVEYLSIASSHPRWVVDRFIREFGYETAESFCAANNTVAPVTLRVNSLKASTAEVIQRLAEKSIHADRSPYLPDAIRISGLRQDLGGIPIYRAGWIQAQDEASQMISHIVAPQGGERILDLCAGFGGKSAHMGMLMGNEGEIVSVDKSAWKLEELHGNSERLGIGIIRPVTADIMELPPEGMGTFDRVLLDAPCTGFGTLRRNPDIKWRRNVKDPYRFSRLQGELLGRAALFVKGGGILVYSTCTVFREENEGVAQFFTDSHPDWVPEPVDDRLPEACLGMSDGFHFRSWPHLHGIDGFFAAMWRKAGG